MGKTALRVFDEYVLKYAACLCCPCITINILIATLTISADRMYTDKYTKSLFFFKSEKHISNKKITLFDLKVHLF